MRSNEVHFVLLAGAGLLLRTFFNLHSTPTGFRAENVLTLHMVVADADEARALEERVSQIPGVRAAGFISLLPLQNSNWNGRFSVTGRAGEGGAAALTRFLKTVLYGVSATDPVTFGAMALLLAAVALTACVIPARRAARVDPAVALRSE